LIKTKIFDTSLRLKAVITYPESRNKLTLNLQIPASMSDTKITGSSMDSTTTYSILTSLLIALALTAGGYFAYQQGLLDPLIEKVGVLVFKAKAKAEEKEMQAEGMKAGEDFVGSQLRGNEQADEVKEGLGSLGGLKKNL